MVDGSLCVVDILVHHKSGSTSVLVFLPQSYLIDSPVFPKYSVEFLGRHGEGKIADVQYPIDFRRKPGLLWLILAGFEMEGTQQERKMHSVSETMTRGALPRDCTIHSMHNHSMQCTSRTVENNHFLHLSPFATRWNHPWSLLSDFVPLWNWMCWICDEPDVLDLLIPPWSTTSICDCLLPSFHFFCGVVGVVWVLTIQIGDRKRGFSLWPP